MMSLNNNVMLNEDEELHELLGYKRIKIIQKKDGFRFSADSTLLSDFINIKPSTKEIIELGCGNGPILLFLTLKTKAKLYGIELQKDIYEIAKKNARINNFTDQIEIINDDLKGIYKKVGHDRFDIVISNPPFFKYQADSNINKNDYLTLARHEVACTLDDVVKESSSLLKQGGSLCMVHRTSRFTEVVATLNKYNFGIKRIRFVYSKKNCEDSLMFLIEGRKNMKDDCKVLAPIYIYDESNNYTEEILKIYNFGIGEE